MRAVPRRTQAHVDRGWWLAQGLAAGIVAGLLLAAYQMTTAILLRGPGAMLAPMRLIAGIVLGDVAVDPGFDPLAAFLSGLMVHLVLAALFGSLFGVIVAQVPRLAFTTGSLICGATGYGLLLWLINLYVVAPAAGWTWLPAETNPVVQLIGHTFVYGSLLGLHLDRAVMPRRPAATAGQ